MPTNKQRLSVTFPEGMFERISKYQADKGFSSSSKAITDLIAKGIDALSATPDDKARLLYLFGQLNDQGRELLVETADTMVRSRKYS